MKISGAAAIGVAGLLLSAAALGQVAQPTLTPSAALRCLTPSLEERRKLAYPEEALERREGGTVSVELRFTGPDDTPSVKVLSENTFDLLSSAVKHHVRQFRVPCMKDSDPPVVIRQEFVFIPNDGRKVVAMTPSDAADEGRREQMRCLVQTGRDEFPEYPRAAVQDDIQGNLLVRMRFTSREQPPEVQVLAGTRKGHLRESVQQFAHGFRLPCLKDSELSTDMLFKFRIDGGARTFLKDMSLVSFLGAVKDLPLPAYFDLDTMACPFDLRVTYEQPYRPNTIGELDGPVEARKPFLDWLSRLTLRLPEASNTEVLGDQFTLSVPCGKVNL